MNVAYKCIIFVTIVLALIISIKVDAKEKRIDKDYIIKPLTYKQAGCNITRYIFMQQELRHAKKSYKYTKKWLKKNKKYKDDKYIHPLYKKMKKIKRIEKDVDLLAHLIYSENGTEGKRCMYCTGSVVLNRKKHKHYPNNIYDVIYQPGQYAVTFDGAINKTPSKEAYKIARDLIFNGTTVPKNVVYQAEFYQGSGIYEQVDETYFCYW